MSSPTQRFPFLYRNLAALGVCLCAPLAVQAATHGSPTMVNKPSGDRMNHSDRMQMKAWGVDKDALQKELKLGESKGFYTKALTDRGFLITSVNTDKPDAAEYEVVKNGRSYEVQLDFDNAGKATKIDITTNMWRTDATKSALAGQTVPVATAYVKGNEAFSDRARMKAWTGEKDKLEKTLATGHDKGWYSNELKKLGYQVTSVNDREKDYVEYEVVKGSDSYEVQIDFEGNKAKKVDVTTNAWQSEATEKALAGAKR